MKLKQLINENHIIEIGIKDEIDELGKLTSQIDRLKKQLQPLQKKYGEVVDKVIPIIDKLDKETITTNNYILKIIRRGYERENFSYKEGFLNGLNKVNKNTKRILQQILEETKKLTKINPSFSVKPIGEGVGEKLKDWYKRFKLGLKKLTKFFNGISDGNRQLNKLI